LAQALLPDKSVDSYIWIFQKIIKATNVYLTVILIDTDLTIDAAICQVFITTYPIHCIYHITQNLHKNLRKVLGEIYKKFFEVFYQCCNSLEEVIFQQ